MAHAEIESSLSNATHSWVQQVADLLPGEFIVVAEPIFGTDETLMTVSCSFKAMCKIDIEQAPEQAKNDAIAFFETAMKSMAENAR